LVFYRKKISVEKKKKKKKKKGQKPSKNLKKTSKKPQKKPQKTSKKNLKKPPQTKANIRIFETFGLINQCRCSIFRRKSDGNVHFKILRQNGQIRAKFSVKLRFLIVFLAVLEGFLYEKRAKNEGNGRFWIGKVEKNERK
jgi:hypothetical protein